MPIADDQIALLETVRSALSGLQTSAATVDVVVQSVTLVFPGGSDPREVTYTWSEADEAFTIST